MYYFYKASVHHCTKKAPSADRNILSYIVSAMLAGLLERRCCIVADNVKQVVQ